MGGGFPSFTFMKSSIACIATLLVVCTCVQQAAAVTAEASHILMADEAKILAVKKELDASSSLGKDFARLAKEHSTCPSGQSGGSLGEFGPGQMVPEFDTAIFKTGKIGKVEGPVKTQFGYHLILITKR